MLPAVYIGTVGVQILGGAAVSSPFTSIIESIIDLGGFPAAVGYITLTASLAAIMGRFDLISGIVHPPPLNLRAKSKTL